MRRICLMGAVIAGSLVFGVAIAPAAKHHKAPKVHPTKVGCKIASSLAIPAGDTAVELPATDGNLYGAATCAGKSFGHGVEADSFVTDDGGDMVVSFKEYFGTGTIKGTVQLTPDDSLPPTPDTFQEQNYTGTVKVMGGSGALAGVTGTGTTICDSGDSVHFSCTEKLKLVGPVVTAKA